MAFSTILWDGREGPALLQGRVVCGLCGSRMQIRYRPRRGGPLIPDVKHATALLWKTLLVAEQRFRRLDSPEFLLEVAEGVVYGDGVREQRGNEEAAA